MLGLHLPIEPGGPLPPLDVKFAPGAFQSVPLLPPQAELARLLTSGETVVERDPEWSELSVRGAAVPARPAAGPDAAPADPDLGRGQEEAAPRARRAGRRGSSGTSSAPGYVPELASPGASPPGRCGPRRSPTASSRRACSGSRPGASAATTAWGTARCCWRSPGWTRPPIAERTRRLAGDDWSCLPARRAAGLRLRPAS